MTLKNVRERTVNIGKLGRILATQPKEETHRFIEQAMRYLVAQFKVNFRPLYAETITNLASLIGTQGETLWDIVWEQLQRTIAADKPHSVDLDWDEPDWTRQVAGDLQSDADATDEDEAEFRCPNLFKGRRVLSKAWMANQDHQILDTDEITVSDPISLTVFATS
jgi:U3 small nucleolar RNA-associated protein 20